MKTIKILLRTIIVFSLIQSCSDEFLDLKPITNSTTGNTFNSADDIEAALVSVYNSLHNEFYIWDNILMGDVRSDNCYAGPPDDVDIWAYDQLKITPNNARIFNNWRAFYLGIARANTVLDKIEDIADLSSTRKSEIIAEVKFLRAFYYFDLVKQYGGVPIVKKTGTADISKTQIPRNTVEEVYAFIIEDLTAAEAGLPDNYEGGSNVNKARATKGTANALLAKVWAQHPSHNYEKVIEHADRVINSPAGYQLLSTYSPLFSVGGNYNNSEAIFVSQFIKGTPQGNWGPQLFLPPSISNDSWRKYGTPSKDLINAYDSQSDLERKNQNIIFESVQWVDEYYNVNSPSTPVPFAYKQKEANGWNSGDHIYFLRLADILLLKAEAMAHLEIGDRGRSIVNQIRNRAGLSNTTATDNEMLNAVLLERRLELALEGHRWDDLVRNNMIIQTMNNLQELNLITNEYVNYDMNENKILLPIPLNEIDRNPELEQNPGY
ncbi:RagB/SusD family nutrient uptake outer membrane protein [Flavivirga sp. 57AJ16]|uniref:RagB/SusD family nutrient uptake outer membrane protein n=1 Tax=Flavivirga sp. 57AJ16 TaxID=3025307 RepID=UPI002366660C|nr:RagB/SusD family nutrient uptake outer membrane protein [Flavivirga sp. 57AJ16]MDD7885083.1 RagB/SusD family nutrient uptake outer membrane protein [Flavivirga sp. 57AJ16]